MYVVGLHNFLLPTPLIIFYCQPAEVSNLVAQRRTKIEISPIILVMKLTLQLGCILSEIKKKIPKMIHDDKSTLSAFLLVVLM